MEEGSLVLAIQGPKVVQEILFWPILVMHTP